MRPPPPAILLHPEVQEETFACDTCHFLKVYSGLALHGPPSWKCLEIEEQHWTFTVGASEVSFGHFAVCSVLCHDTWYSLSPWQRCCPVVVNITLFWSMTEL